MIQELFGSSSTLLGANVGVVNGDTKLISISSNGGIILEGTPAAPPSSSSTPSSNNSSSSAATPSAKKCSGPAAEGAGSNSSASEGQQNLRCPRCDSPNTKFCYYNNYNLTQPRHFCKTCRRYWTKGGALRNVPIGGGCRKNKASTISSSVAKSCATKFKSLSASGFIGGLDHELPSNPVMWGSTHGSHLLALLRGSPINPNPNPSSFIKEELHLLGGHVMIEPGMGSVDGMRPCGLGLDPMNQQPSMGLCSSFFRNITQQSSIQQNPAPNPQSHPNGGFNILSEVPNDNAIHALYQRLKLSTGDYDTDQPHIAALNSQDMARTSSPTPLAPESGSGGIGSDQLSYWSGNNTSNMCWSDLPTSNGAYP